MDTEKKAHLSPGLDAWCDLLIDAGRHAFRETKAMIGTAQARELISRGAGGDITARIDQVAENIVINRLKAAGIPFVLISEEVGILAWDGQTRKNLPHLTLETAQRLPTDYVILDPVDGSSNAMRGIPFSCVSLAYADGPTLSHLKVGVLVDLQTGDVYSAVHGQGAMKNGAPIQCSPITSIHEVFMATDLDTSRACQDIIHQGEPLFDRVSKRRILGSCALELGYIGAGVIDLLFDVRGHLRVVDIAAGLVIVKEAGGFLMNAQGDPLQDHVFDLDSRYSLVAGCPGIHAKIVAIIKHTPRVGPPPE